MIVPAAGNPHLTYCTNIHPGETWAEIRRNLERYTLGVKSLVAPSDRFGLGLRLSNQAAQELTRPEAMAAFQEFLKAHDLYVFTLNGFPYGAFSRTRVKETVYLPDWTARERLHYSNRLAHLLASLLPESRIEGSISTVPGGFRERIRTPADIATVVDHLIQLAVSLQRIHESTGKTIMVALEPEPGCMLETTAEAVAFLRDHLFSRPSTTRFSRLSGLTLAGSEQALQRHLGLCLDACHSAVAFEDPGEVIRAVTEAGVRIAKLQVSTGLLVRRFDPPAHQALRAFADTVYLHQVVERSASELTRYPDLPEALTAWEASPCRARHEWRIHVHVPVFLHQLGLFENTQAFLSHLLRLQHEKGLSSHLEVETYTWDVLPEAYRTTDVIDAVARELRWVLDRMNG